MVGVFTVFEQSSTLTILTVFSFRRAEQIPNGIRGFVERFYLFPILVIRFEEVIPRVVVEVNTFTRKEVCLAKQSIPQIPMEAHVTLFHTAGEDALLRHSFQHISLSGDFHPATQLSLYLQSALITTYCHAPVGCLHPRELTLQREATQ